MTRPATASEPARRLADQDLLRIAYHKAQLRKAFMRAAAEINALDWTDEDEHAADLATQWLFELARRANYPKPATLPRADTRELASCIETALMEGEAQ